MMRPRKNVQELHRYPVLQEGRYDKLRLDKNENTIGFPEHVIKTVLSQIGPHTLAAYPEPYRLYQQLAKHHDVSIDNILLTAGSEMAIRYVFEAFLESGDEILVLNPSFAMFEVYAALCEAKVVFVNYSPDLQISTEAIINQISPKTKIVAIANPNNPTGTVINQPELIEIVRAAAACDAILLMDEAYFHFYGETLISHWRRFPNLVVTRTFSKACGLAGVRLGYALGSEEIIGSAKKLQPIDHISSFAVKFGEFVMDHDDLVSTYVSEINTSKQYLVRELRNIGFKVSDNFGNFVLVDFGAAKDLFVEGLKDRNVLVGANLRLPFSSGYVRITVGPIEQMQRLVDMLIGLRMRIDGYPK